MISDQALPVATASTLTQSLPIWVQSHCRAVKLPSVTHRASAWSQSNTKKKTAPTSHSDRLKRFYDQFSNRLDGSRETSIIQISFSYHKFLAFLHEISRRTASLQALFFKQRRCVIQKKALKAKTVIVDFLPMCFLRFLLRLSPQHQQMTKDGSNLAELVVIFL